MPFTSAGTDIALVRNPATGRFDIQWDVTGPNGGNPVYDNSETHRCASLIVAERGKWTMDPTGQRGSTLYLLKNDTAATRDDIANATRAALDKAVQDRAILPDIQITVTRTGPGSYVEVVQYQTPDGNTVPISLSI